MAGTLEGADTDSVCLAGCHPPQLRSIPLTHG
jgi:hypothetical protein